MEEGLDQELHSLAHRKGVPVSELVRDALGRFVEEQTRRRRFRLRFLAGGKSGKKSIAQQHENLLWRDLEPHGTKKWRKRGV